MAPPKPFLAINPPFLVDSSGKVLSDPVETDPGWPVFIRAALLGKVYEAGKYPNPNWKLSNYPGPFLWGGPFPQSQYELVKSQLEQWAFAAPLTTVHGPEPGFFVVSHMIPIAPATGATPWPKDARFRWQWLHETMQAPRYRVVYTGLAGGQVVRA